MEDTHSHATPEQNEAFKDLFMWAGFALITWQDVEAAHCRLFVKLIGSTRTELCSAIYFHIQSFSSRCDMVNKVISLALLSDQQKLEWRRISKLIRAQLEKRNNIAHYELGATIEGPGPKVVPGLRRLNLKGKDKHSLTGRDLYKQSLAFQELAKLIMQFTRQLA
jgi:hypothetical protein